ncbi:MAG: TRAP transporter substrate-binding protein DctP [Nanoarchaeota archaeon]|nr:TRAP transporter substrate-binding protein DctP [Nanoarchaeota archaeon]
MKRTVLIVWSTALILGVIISSGSVSAKSINPTPENPITLKMATFFASEKDIRQVFTRKWGEGITKATNGAIKFRYFPGQQLVKAKEMSDALQNGIIDANTWFVPSYTPEDYPFFAAVTMIPYALPDDYDRVKGLSRDGEELLFGDFKKHNIKHLWSMFGSYGQEWFFKDAWDPKDPAKNFQKKRVRSPGIIAARVLIKYLGAEQVSMSAPEAYEAGQKGIIQGCTLGFSQYANSHTYEVFPYVMFANTTFTQIGGTPCVMRRDLFESLPANMQKDIVKVSENLEKEFFYAYREEVNKLRDDLVKSGKIKQYIEMDPTIKAQWKKEVDPMIDKELTQKFPEKFPQLRTLLNKYQKK